MTISVIIPAWNSERYLREALNSVFAQTKQPFEVIVVDDGSTDSTCQVARAFPVRYEYQDHAGAASARNKGLRLAQGEFIAFLDSDDLWLPQKLERQLQAFDLNLKLQICFTGIEQFISPDTPEVCDQVILHQGLETTPTTTTLLARREAFDQVGNFLAFQGGDWIAWLSAAQHLGLEIQTIPRCLARRRIHYNNMGRTLKTEIQSDYLRMLRQHLHRKRQA